VKPREVPTRRFFCTAALFLLAKVTDISQVFSASVFRVKHLPRAKRKIIRNIGKYSHKDEASPPKSMEPSEVVLFAIFCRIEKEKYFHCFLYSLQTVQVIKFIKES
jgi:hypothetical protein